MPVGKTTVSSVSKRATPPQFLIQSVHILLRDAVSTGKEEEKKKCVTKVLAFVRGAMFYGIRIPPLPLFALAAHLSRLLS